LTHNKFLELVFHIKWHLRFKNSSSETVGRNRGRRTEQTSVNKPTIAKIPPTTARERLRNIFTQPKAVASGRTGPPRQVPGAVAKPKVKIPEPLGQCKPLVFLPPKTGKRTSLISPLLTTRTPTSNGEILETLSSAIPSPSTPNRDNQDAQVETMTGQNGAEGSKPPLFSPCDTCKLAACDPNNCAQESVRESKLIHGGHSS